MLRNVGAMTGTSTSANSPGLMSWSPDQFTCHATKIHRRYVQIASNQRALLDRPDAWSPSGLPNVPPGVLGDVRACHARALRTSLQAEIEAASSQPASLAHHDREQSPQVEVSSESGLDREAEEEESQSGTHLEWSPSPSWHYRAPHQEEKLAAKVHRTSQHSPAKKRSTTAPAAVSRAAYLNQFPPSSSLASESGLEVEVPGAITDVLETVNREALPPPEPTPPSAQIIPCTLTDLSNPARVPQARKRRFMVHPSSYFPDPENVGQKQITKPVLQPPVQTRPSRSPSPSPTIISSSPVAKPSAPLPVGDRHLFEVENEPGVAIASPQHVVPQVSNNSTDKLPPNGPPSQVPYTAFKMEYPDYSGSLGDFIRGVLCILRLQKERAFPGFLYDDFVRVFSSDYLDYVESVNGKEPILPAVQWYNENISKPVYTKGILNRSNINDILGRYPDEVRAIRQQLVASGPNTQDQEQPRTPAARGRHRHTNQQTPSGVSAADIVPDYHTPMAAGPMEINGSPIHRFSVPSSPIHTTEQVFRVEGRHEATNIAISGSRPFSARRSSVEMAGTALAANSPESESVSLQSQVDLPFPAIEESQSPEISRVEARPSRLADGFPSTIHTQESNPESIAEPIRKRRVSQAGEPGASYKKPRRTKQDAKTAFVNRVKENLVKRRAAQSSAPGSSRPS